MPIDFTELSQDKEFQSFSEQDKRAYLKEAYLPAQDKEFGALAPQDQDAYIDEVAIPVLSGRIDSAGGAADGIRGPQQAKIDSGSPNNLDFFSMIKSALGAPYAATSALSKMPGPLQDMASGLKTSIDSDQQDAGFLRTAQEGAAGLLGPIGQGLFGSDRQKAFLQGAAVEAPYNLARGLATLPKDLGLEGPANLLAGLLPEYTPTREQQRYPLSSFVGNAAPYFLVPGANAGKLAQGGRAALGAVAKSAAINAGLGGVMDPGNVPNRGMARAQNAAISGAATAGLEGAIPLARYGASKAMPLLERMKVPQRPVQIKAPRPAVQQVAKQVAQETADLPALTQVRQAKQQQFRQLATTIAKGDDVDIKAFEQSLQMIDDKSLLKDLEMMPQEMLNKVGEVFGC